MPKATFRFYEELNDFLPPSSRKRDFVHAFNGTPSVKDTIEALGVPHVEVDLILVDDTSVDFGHRLHGDERVAVYPVFESLDISPLQRLRPRPLRETRFVADVHLGRLARRLRMLGFDTIWRNDLADPEIVEIAGRERRCVLTRDLGILKTGAVDRGYWLRSTDPQTQLLEILDRFDLRRALAPFSRCSHCNGVVSAVDKADIVDRLEDRTRRYYHSFGRCDHCGRIYWRGSHFRRLNAWLDSLDEIGS